MIALGTAVGGSAPLEFSAVPLHSSTFLIRKTYTWYLIHCTPERVIVSL